MSAVEDAQILRSIGVSEGPQIVVGVQVVRIPTQCEIFYLSSFRFEVMETWFYNRFRTLPCFRRLWPVFQPF